MGLLDDAIRDHLQLKRAHGAREEEIQRLEQEALGPARASGEFAPTSDAPGTGGDPAPAPVTEEHREAPAAEPDLAAPADPDSGAVAEDEPHAQAPVAPEPTPEPESGSRLRRAEPEPWLDDPDEVPADEALEHRVPRDEDVLEETPEFLQETPEHDRLWFEQKPPRGFDFDK